MPKPFTRICNASNIGTICRSTHQLLRQLRPWPALGCWIRRRNPGRTILWQQLTKPAGERRCTHRRSRRTAQHSSEQTVVRSSVSAPYSAISTGSRSVRKNISVSAPVGLIFTSEASAFLRSVSCRRPIYAATVIVTTQPLPSRLYRWLPPRIRHIGCCQGGIPWHCIASGQPRTEDQLHGIVDHDGD